MAVRAVSEQHECSPEEYLAAERRSQQKHEYIDGELVAMAGASPEHTQMMFNISAELAPQLREKPCRGFTADLRVRTSRRHYCYPDIVIACEPPQYAPEDPHTLLNPTLIVEILTPSTEAYDRGLKFRRYARLESVQEYVLVSQDRPWIERFLRMPNGQWAYAEAYGLDAALELQSIGCTLRLASVYDKVALPPEREGAPTTAE